MTEKTAQSVANLGYHAHIYYDPTKTRAVAERRNPQAVKVEEIASHDLVTVESEQDLDDALALMARHKVRRLPVLEGGRLVGMLAQADIALGAKEEKVGEMVEQISQRT